jgi:hypothetical protein
MSTELCTCCGEGGRGFNETHPQVWIGCQCLGVRRCDDCSNCFEHCLCTPVEQRLEALDREAAATRESVAEARHLAAALGIDEVHGTLNDDTIGEIEQLLRARYRAFRRLRRRIDHLFDIDHIRQSVERRLAPEVITVESDRPS